ncbi:MAG: hypothetical protein J7521_00160 [Caulobacter sp.]|nr:hypothetical protein [Caulobacter sp.]
MARPPNYRHERSERLRIKADRIAEKAAAKAQARAADRTPPPASAGRTDEP